MEISQLKISGIRCLLNLELFQLWESQLHPPVLSGSLTTRTLDSVVLHIHGFLTIFMFHVFFSLDSFYLLFKLIGIFSSCPASAHPLLFYISTVILPHILCLISSKDICSSCPMSLYTFYFCFQYVFNCLSKQFSMCIFYGASSVPS